jgi:hypothetical protein
MIIVMVAPPMRKLAVAATAETKSGRLRLLRQGWRLREACFKEFWNNDGSALLLHSLFCAEGSGDGDAESLLYFNSLHASYSIFVSVMSLMYSVNSLEM